MLTIKIKGIEQEELLKNIYEAIKKNSDCYHLVADADGDITYEKREWDNDGYGYSYWEWSDESKKAYMRPHFGDDGKMYFYIIGQKHDHCIFRRLLDCLQQRVLRLKCQLLRLVDDINLVRTAVRLDHHIVNELLADFIDADGVRLFMLHINDIRMILALCLFTGRAFHTGLDPVLLALKRHRKQ